MKFPTIFMYGIKNDNPPYKQYPEKYKKISYLRARIYSKAWCLAYRIMTHLDRVRPPRGFMYDRSEKIN